MSKYHDTNTFCWQIINNCTCHTQSGFKPAEVTSTSKHNKSYKIHNCWDSKGFQRTKDDCYQKMPHGTLCTRVLWCKPKAKASFLLTFAAAFAINRKYNKLKISMSLLIPQYFLYTGILCITCYKFTTHTAYP